MANLTAPNYRLLLCLLFVAVLIADIPIAESFPSANPYAFPFNGPPAAADTQSGNNGGERTATYQRAPDPSGSNQMDFGNGLSNPPPVPAGFNPNAIPYSHWSVITGNNADPYAYRSFANHAGMPPMTGINVDGTQYGQGGYLMGLFPGSQLG